MRPDLAVGETLLAVARHILAEARTAIEDPGKPDSKAVHDFRRQMKRWRALLRLLEPFLAEGGTGLRLRARDLARALGGARDAQSALDALMDLAHQGLALSPRSLATLHDRIAHIRQTAETTVLTGDMRLSDRRGARRRRGGGRDLAAAGADFRRDRSASCARLPLSAKRGGPRSGRGPTPRNCTNCANG